jgi:hypothetical protein
LRGFGLTGAMGARVERGIACDATDTTDMESSEGSEGKDGWDTDIDRYKSSTAHMLASSTSLSVMVLLANS